MIDYFCRTSSSSDDILAVCKAGRWAAVTDVTKKVLISCGARGMRPQG